LENLDSGVGIYAPDSEAYVIFADIFDPIIDDYHGGFKKTARHPPTNWGDLNSIGNVDPDGTYVISTRIRCGRSLDGYPFNPCLSESQYKEMEKKVAGTLTTLGGEFQGKYYPLTGMSKTDQQQLIDDHFLFKEGDRFLQSANACRFWPTGRGIFHNNNKTFLVWVNEEDHLRIISMQPGGDVGEVYRRLMTGVQEIEKKLKFSRSDRFGYLTFCPTNLGTTIRASVHIRLPKLGANVNKLESVALNYNLQVRGTRGEHSEAEKGVYDISNKKRLGLTEYEALEDGFKKLIVSNSHSLLKKYLTQAIFDKLKTKKTSFGSTLLDCIQSGLENLDSNVGIYAPDSEAYITFADIFDPIINDYHGGFKKTDRHPPTNWGDLNTIGNVDPGGKYIVSTRVRCGRSLDGYPFNPCLSESQYKEMEKKVTKTLTGLSGELQGKYYPLLGMSKSVQQQLIDDHFLFKEGDRFLQAANACRFWPVGRGIYHNNNKTFLVWVNEEDHLRIISMQPGGNVGEEQRSELRSTLKYRNSQEIRIN
ncbi:ATP-gua Ptrans domain containing protein, partial [Asbolus verrucosus]